jgi:hypothetical protein
MLERLEVNFVRIDVRQRRKEPRSDDLCRSWLAQVVCCTGKGVAARIPPSLPPAYAAAAFRAMIAMRNGAEALR